jgi:hypothetical protein
MRDATRFKKTYSIYREEPRTEGSSCVICNTILNGTTAPASGLGLIDDIYINTSTMELYGPKTESGWGDPFELGGSGSGGGGGTELIYQWNELGNAILNTTGSITLAGNLGSTFSTEDVGSDVFLFIGESSTANKSVFGADVIISGTLDVKNGNNQSVLTVNNNKVGIGLANPIYALEVNGDFAATTKSFVIDHPSKPGWKLRHGVLEGPENGVYIRGKSNSRIIKLPEYWKNLVDKESITINITPIESPHVIYVKSVSINEIIVDCNEENINYYYKIHASRKDCTFEIEYLSS